MSDIEKIKKLRESTGAGFKDCNLAIKESKGDLEITSSLIGEQVMEALKQIDQIGYVRFASVYRNFSEASDFQKFLGQELDN